MWVSAWLVINHYQNHPIFSTLWKKQLTIAICKEEVNTTKPSTFQKKQMTRGSKQDNKTSTTGSYHHVHVFSLHVHANKLRVSRRVPAWLVIMARHGWFRPVLSEEPPSLICSLCWHHRVIVCPRKLLSDDFFTLLLGIKLAKDNYFSLCYLMIFLHFSWG